MSKTKHDFITDFLFEVNGQFHQPDYDMLDSFYDLMQKECEEKNKWIKVKNDSVEINSESDFLIKFKCSLNLERIIVGHIFQGKFYMNFSDNMRPLKNVIAYRYFL